MKGTLTYIFMLTAGACFAQVSLERQVISSAGTYSSTSSISIASTTGQPAATTLSSAGMMLTQGFQQPSVIAGIELQSEIVSYSASCLTLADGAAKVKVLNGTPPYTYNWSPEAGSTDSLSGVVPGQYIVFITDAFGRTGADTVVITSEVADACDIHVYSGFTPNNDGHNDLWIIDGILLFPENSVEIFSRLGSRVWNASGYNNADVVWDGRNNSGLEMPSGTYFYVVAISSTKAYKGWVQLTR